jgi:sugar phosphate isomerase/epimerase
MQRWSRREVIAGGAVLLSGSLRREAVAAPVKKTEKPMNLKLGLVTYNIAKDWDLPTLLQHCKSAGWEGIELRTTHAHGVEPGIGAAHQKEVKQRFADAGLTLWGLGTVCEFHMPDRQAVREQIESCKRWCELAAGVGARGVKVRPNGYAEGVPEAKTQEQIGEALRECGVAAQNHGVEVWLEVHGRGTAHPPAIRRIMDICQHPQVGVCWNSNPQDIRNGSIQDYFDLLRPDLKSCHINDLWNESYPYRELFRRLTQCGYDRFTLCEVGTPIGPEAGLPFMRCYRGLWRELQRA